MPLNWDHIRYFTAVADHGSVSRAAQSLDVSHATILRAVERLEGELQLRLFDRARTGYRITEDGLAILEHARAMGNEAQQLQLRARARDSMPSGELNLALPDQSLFDCMPLLRKFTSDYPNITVNLTHAEIRRTDDFIDQGVDLLLLICNDAPEDFVGRRLCRIGFGVYAAAAGVDSSNENCWVRWSLPGYFGTAGMEEQQVQLERLAGTGTRLDAGSHDTAVSAIRAGLGIGLLAGAAATGLEPVAISGRLPEPGLWCLTHPDFRHTARVSALMRFLAEALA